MAPFLLGQPRVERALTHAFSSGRLAHGLLFAGPAGVGKEKAARGVACALVCEQKVAPFGCGACRGCRRALSGSHPDVHILMPEAEAVRRGIAEPDGKKKPSADILVDAVRELAVRLRMAPYEAGARVAIVVDAHRMNTNAQNALLKTLEEPASSTWIILLVPHERTVLPTIASRCLRLSFAPLSIDDVGAVLRGQGLADAEARARLSEGSVARALAVDPAAAASGDALMGALFSGTAAEHLDLAEALGKERSDVDLALAELERRVAVAVRSAVSGVSASTGASGGATTIDWRRGVAALDRVHAARAAIAQNASVQLCLEELLLSR